MLTGLQMLEFRRQFEAAIKLPNRMRLARFRELTIKALSFPEAVAELQPIFNQAGWKIVHLHKRPNMKRYPWRRRRHKAAKMRPSLKRK